MLNNNKNIDNLFHNGLNNLEIEPSNDLWANIEDKLNKKQNKKKTLAFTFSHSGTFKYIVSGIAASIIIALSIGLLNSTDKNSIKKSVALISNPILNNNPIKYTNQNLLSIPSGNNTNSKIIKQQIRLLSQKTNKTYNAKSFLSKKETSKNQKNTEYVQIYKYTPALKYKLSNSIIENKKNWDDTIIELNKVNLKKDKINKFTLKGSFMQPKTNYSSTNNEIAFASNIPSNNTSKENLSSFEAGINFKYTINRKISIVSGIKYAELSHSNSNQKMVMESYSFREYTDNSSKEQPQSYAVNNITSNSGKTRFVNKALQKVSGIENAMVKNESNNKITQDYKYIEIPFLLNYKIGENRLSYNLALGLSTSFLVSNEAKLESENNTIYGETESINNVNFSTILGFGFNYKISRNLSLELEPQIKVFLNSINSNPNYDFKPYFIGVSTGFCFGF